MKRLAFVVFFMLKIVTGWTQHTQGFIPVNNGRLYYEKTGTGLPLVFLHGVCLDHRMWQQQIDYFSNSYTCINVDLRGFGKSSLPDTTPYSFHEDVNTLLDSLHIIEPVILIALSMGGKAAINFCLAYPERTKCMVLADVAVDGYNFKDFKLDRIAKVAQQKGTDSANQSFLHNPIFTSAKSDSMVFSHIRQMVLSYSGWQWINKNPIHGLSPPAIEQLNRIRVPVLIITGEKDISDFQQIASLLYRNIKQSIKKEIPGAGHMCNMERPDAFNHLVSDFLRSNK